MSETANRTVVVANPAGLHLRAAALIADAVRGSSARRSTLAKGTSRSRRTEVLQLMSLAADAGGEAVLEAVGQDAAAALDALAQLFRDKFGEE